jgi:hypothetical protein
LETPRRTRPRVIICLLSLAVATCGGDSTPSPPTSPSPPSYPLRLREGLNSVTFTGLGLSTDPQYPPCVPLGVPRSGTSVSTQVTLEHLGSEWVGRSPSAALGTLEIRLRDTGPWDAPGTVVSGTVRGAASDRGEFLRPPLDVQVSLTGSSGLAVVEGWSHRVAFFAYGRITGSIAFTDSQNAVGSCTAVQWILQPVMGVPQLIPPIGSEHGP